MLAAPAPPAAVAEPPPKWAVRPSDSEVREAAAYRAQVNDRPGVARMRCIVRADGGLEACAAARSGPDEAAYAPALLFLARRFRLDLRAGPPPSTVVVEQAFPKLVDVDSRTLKKPDAADRARANTGDLRGEVGLRCTVTATGLLADCAPDPERGGDAALLPAALSLTAQYRYAPARKAGAAVASPTMLELTFVSHGDTPAGWVRKPDMSQLRAVWPLEAARRGVNGRAVLHCRVTIGGVLARCEVKQESPEGLGFGGAALALTPNFAMKAATHLGAPIESEVSIPINFEGLGPASGVVGSSVRVLAWMPWLAAPSLADVRRAYPAGAASARTFGSVAFQCGLKPDGALSGCGVSQEFPASAGFAPAARKLLPSFKADLTGLEPGMLASVRVAVAVRFSAHALDTPAAYDIVQADWVRAPDADLVRAAYPAAAKAAGVSSGRAIVDCFVADDGTLGRCHALSEDPNGLGFAPAVERVAGALKLNLWTREGEPSAGAHLRLPMRMVDGGGAASAPSP